ncbi:LytTR family transcriptional regulator [Tateyamaria omphalii]|uniref:LytTR family DNA-binding domain-containing protein n=1 Tax=Tateyamaria omphalii TaxID=299262 RepID=UPI001C998FF6|nr:LytTR family DNA-binding domain-containing protein [Tateyamaria omphalii]MBY5931441.1 LytTR family transcriptional regulator [Tateyamaria omphalii]
MKDPEGRTGFASDGLRSNLLSVLGSGDLSWRQLAQHCLAFAVVGGLVITSFDPSVTSGMPFWAAVLHWVTHLFLAAVLLMGTATLVALSGLRMPWPLVVAICFLPLLLAPFSMALDVLLGEKPDDSLINAGFSRRYVEELLNVAPPSLGLSAIMAVFAYRAAEMAKQQRHAILSRLAPEPALRSAIPVPHSLGDDLVRIEAQDHYVSVVTTEGTATMKLALSDCVEALKEFRGMQCHRSHWVRFRHIKRVKRVGSAYACVLENGTEVPVSRRRHAQLKKRL